ncbi:Sorting nexin-1 [Clonorchis sinensis]|uniref:Sorting nexin-1 n=1 Tax=Clonorchis sinensis TaxID=79923 RepID=A0A8T1MNB5_CLOSI|nr:Sorting nexin-1 [Clonorchis sinensis]
MSKDISQENEFVERRRVALERFLHRLLNHPVLREDPDLREFLEFTGDLPRSVNTQLLSGASAKKIFKNVGDAIGKIAYKMEDPDDGALRSKYFDLKFEELESWERQLKRLHSALSLLVSSNQDLASSKFTVSRTISQLANVEEHTGLAQALGRLADTEEEVSQQHAVLAEAELTYLVDFARDTLGMIQACKDALDERVKAFRNWKTAEALLRMKREQKVRLELAGRYDQRKMVGLDAEIDETTKRVEQEQERFNNISNIIKVEMERVDLTRFDDLKQAATDFLEVMLQNQEKCTRCRLSLPPIVNTRPVSTRAGENKASTMRNSLIQRSIIKKFSCNILLVPGCHATRRKHDTLSVPNCHATRRLHEGWDTARLPKPRQGKSRGRGRVRTTDLPVSKFALQPRRPSREATQRGFPTLTYSRPHTWVSHLHLLSIPNPVSGGLFTSTFPNGPGRPFSLIAFHVHTLKQAGEQASLLTLDSLDIAVCYISETRIQDTSTVVELTAPSLSSRF